MIPNIGLIPNTAIVITASMANAIMLAVAPPGSGEHLISNIIIPMTTIIPTLYQPLSSVQE